MPKLLFALFAQRVVVDRFTNLLDIQGVIEGLTVQAPPAEIVNRAKKDKKRIAVHIRMMLVTHWRREAPSTPEGKHEMRVQMRSAKNELLATAFQEFSLREHIFMRNIIGFENLPITGAGTYTAQIAIKNKDRWKAVGSVPIEIAYGPPPVDAPPPDAVKH